MYKQVMLVCGADTGLMKTIHFTCLKYLAGASCKCLVQQAARGEGRVENGACVYTGRGVCVPWQWLPSATNSFHVLRVNPVAVRPAGRGWGC